MSSFSQYANEFISGRGDWNSLPRMIQDCIRTSSRLREYKEYNKLQIPILVINGGSPYTSDDIKDGLYFLRNLGIKSFVFAESSTYALQLLEQLFSVPVELNLSVSCSSSSKYQKKITDRWGGTHDLHGIVIKITERKTSGK